MRKMRDPVTVWPEVLVYLNGDTRASWKDRRHPGDILVMIK